MSKSARLFIISLLLVFLLDGKPQAQNQYTLFPCLIPDYFAPYWTSNAVFVGLAEKVLAENNQVIVKFTVEKSIRGIGGETVMVYTSNSPEGYSFKEGERYFVYAHKGSNGQLYESRCDATVLLKEAGEDLEYAEDVASGKSGTRIYGNVYQDKQDSYKTHRENVPLAEIEVTIQNKNNKFQTKTDEKGRYVFKNIPAGLYNVQAQIPNGLREKNLPAAYQDVRDIRNLKAHQVYIGEDSSFDIYNPSAVRQPFYRYWDRLDFAATSLSSIKGKFIGYDGKNPPQQFVWLLPISDGKAILDFPTAHLWADSRTGEFFFNGIPKGRYLLSVNPNNCPEPRNTEYGRTFFPGVSAESEAQLITVKENQQIKLQNYRLLPPLKAKWFSGEVLSVDNLPIAGTTVFMTGYTKECSILSGVGETKTDKFGRFRLKGYETYNYKIRAYTETAKQDGSTPRMYSKLFELPLEGKVENIKLIIDSTY